MDKLKMHSPDLSEKNIEKIKAIFPNCVTESRAIDGTIKLAIDFDLLKQELSATIVDGPQERYHLNWPGKREALLTANAPIKKTLRPYKQESVDFDTTKNLFIEGDNLDALKLLQDSFFEQVKVIYIDPPYNTGNDFVYSDNFQESNLDYLASTVQIDDIGQRYSANLESDGRFHSKWLSMIFPRLKIARNLLTEDGIIFVSIGVEELPNLKKVMDEIFGESNFIEIFSWVKTSTPPALSTKSRKTNEYILCYEKNKSSIKYNGELLDGGDAPLLNTGNPIRRLKFPKDKVFFSYINEGEINSGKKDRVSLTNDLKIHKGFSTTDFELEGEFKWSQEFLNNEIENGTTFIIKSEKFSIRFLRSGEGFKRPTNFIKEKYSTPVINKTETGVGTNEVASSELKDLMGSEVFSYPKPVSLIKHLINFNISDNDIVLDFFAGSATTAEAVFRLNAENGLNVRFIMVQLPEKLDDSLGKANDPNVKKQLENAISFCDSLAIPRIITSLSKERIKRAANIISEKKIKNGWNGDVGFRVLKVDSSNMNDVYYSPEDQIQSSLNFLVNNIKIDRNEDDLLFQVLTDWGIQLSIPILKKLICEKTVYLVGDNSLVACFDSKISEQLVREIALLQPLRVVFRDDGFQSDALKINAEQIFRQLSPHTEIKTI